LVSLAGIFSKAFVITSLAWDSKSSMVEKISKEILQIEIQAGKYQQLQSQLIHYK
jgi:hypothetical protein